MEHFWRTCDRVVIFNVGLAALTTSDTVSRALLEATAPCAIAARRRTSSRRRDTIAS